MRIQVDVPDHLGLQRLAKKKALGSFVVYAITRFLDSEEGRAFYGSLIDDPRENKKTDRLDNPPVSPGLPTKADSPPIHLLSTASRQEPQPEAGSRAEQAQSPQNAVISSVLQRMAARRDPVAVEETAVLEEGTPGTGEIGVMDEFVAGLRRQSKERREAAIAAGKRNR